MLPTVIAVAAVAALLAAWVLSTRRKLAVLEENVNNAMNQIGVQLSCRFEALSAFWKSQGLRRRGVPGAGGAVNSSAAPLQAGLRRRMFCVRKRCPYAGAKPSSWRSTPT